MKKRLYFSAIAILAFGFATNTQAVSLWGLLTVDAGYKDDVEIAPGVVKNLYQGGSYFAMGVNNPNGNAAMLSAGTDGGIQLGTFQNFVTDPDEPHPDGHPDAPFGAGSGYNALVSEGTALSSFSFFGNPTYVGLNPVSYQSGLSKSAPSLNLLGGTCAGNVCDIEVDLSAWEVYWNGSVFEQGPRPDNSQPFTLASGTVNTVSGDYVLDWSSQILGGPFNGVTAYWHLEGQLLNATSVPPVPVPGAVWLFGSGLVGLIGISRKKKSS